MNHERTLSEILFPAKSSLDILQYSATAWTKHSTYKKELTLLLSSLTIFNPNIVPGYR